MRQVEFHSLYHVLDYFEVNCESRNPKSKKKLEQTGPLLFNASPLRED